MPKVQGRQSTALKPDDEKSCTARRPLQAFVGLSLCGGHPNLERTPPVAADHGVGDAEGWPVRTESLMNAYSGRKPLLGER